MALVRHDYQELSRLGRLSASEIENAIIDYGGSVTPVPNEALERINVIRIRDVEPACWYVGFNLWMDDQPSDLTLELTVKSFEYGSLTAEIDDLHVL
ncbi:MAG: hypothetical protein PVG14_08075 [Anaerolineales bacterium]|jgi:hypothetical protein